MPSFDAVRLLILGAFFFVHECISSTVFKIYVENALKTWKRMCRGTGVKMNGKELITVRFTDDQVIITEIRENLEKMIEEIGISFTNGD